VDERATGPDGTVDERETERGGHVRSAPELEPDASTGDEAVDEALTLLAALDEQPLRSHVAAFDAVHGSLQDRLADAEG